MSYNLAFAVFGGLSPVICTIAIHSFNTVMAPAIYIILVALLSWWACYLKRDPDIEPSLEYTLHQVQRFSE